MKASERLIDVAAAVGDGSAVDWERLAVDAQPAERVVLAHLRVIDRLASVHASWPPVAAFERSLRNSLHSEAPGPSVPPSSAPATWGPLAILQLIGTGTYADVYRAYDPRLDRTVALKLLRHRESDDGAAESDAIEEARLLARIEHPNVVSVYGAERVAGQVGIWMRFVEGQTLEQELRARGPFSAEALVEAGTAMCRALSAVHAAGLIHRDVKAQNVLRDGDGRVLLADFGTGREVDELPSGRELAGTPLYLAPEVLNGQPASVVSDIYSLGVLLYHLATGSFPVSGRSLSDLRDGQGRAAFVPLERVRPDLPQRIVAAIDRALSVDGLARHANAAAFEDALQARAHRGRHVGLSVAAVAIILIGFAALRRPTLKAPAVAAGEPAFGMRSLTFNGDSSAPDISRDGRVVAYLRGFDQSLWVRHIDAADDRQILSEDRSRQLQALTLTPDAAAVDVVVMQSGSSVPELRRVSLSEGTTRLIAAQVESSPGWSPDGTRMAFVSEVAPAIQPNATGVVVAAADGSSPRLLATLRMPSMFLGLGFVIRPASNRPAWSPDGRTIAVASIVTRDRVSLHVTLVDAATGAQRDAGVIAQRWSSSPDLCEVAWLDGTHLLVNRQGENPGTLQIWRLDATSGAFTAVTRDLASFGGLSITGDRQIVASTRTESRAAIWVGGPSGEGMSVRIPESAANPRRPSFDERGDLIYTAETAEGTWAWMLRPGTSEPRRIVRGVLSSVTPKGDAVVLLDAGEQAGIFRADLDGSRVVPLVSGTYAQAPEIAPDGRTVLFLTHDQDGLQSIWTVASSGGVPRELIRRFAYAPSISHDGRQLIFGSRDAASNSGAVFVVCDWPACTHATELPIPPMARRIAFMLTPDGRGVAYAVKNAGGPENIWTQPLEGGPARQMTHFTDVRTITGFNWSPDGRQLAVARAATTSDVVVLQR